MSWEAGRLTNQMGVMDTALLATRLHIPSVRSELVPRPRQTARLDEGLRLKLTLVSTRAGLGKTALVSTWISQGETPAAWVSLDAGDSDRARPLAFT